MKEQSQRDSNRRQALGAAGLVVTAFCVLASFSLANREVRAERAEQAGDVGRLNGIIERAERGELNFNGESWQMLPDQEHDIFGLLALQSALAELRPEGSPYPTRTPVVRMSMEANRFEKHRVKQYLDVGLMGLILSQVKTREEVYEFVQSMRYPPQGSHYPEGPEGTRGFAPTRATQFWGVDMDTYMRKADVWPLNPNGELLALVMLETKEAIENIDEILEVPGLGGVLIGMSDMSMSYGLGTPAPPGDHPVIREAIQKVADACAAHHARGGKVICGAYQTPQGLETAIEEQAFTMFTFGRGEYRRDLQ